MTNNINLAEIDQEQALNLCRFFIKSNQNIFLLGRRGTGKQLSLNTELPTPNGFIKLFDLNVGDELFDELGNICKVLQLHNINVSPESYEIEFSDGTKIQACADHRWPILNKKNNIESDVEYSSLSNTDIFNIKTTKEIFNTLDQNHCIKNTLPINYSKKYLKIDPYVFGWLIGEQGSDIKSIPNNYLHSSIDQRCDLLNGIIDSCFVIMNYDDDEEYRHEYEYKTNLLEIFNQIKDLISSLGLTCHTENELGLNKIKFNRHNFIKNLSRYIINVIKIPPVPMRCITVDSESHLFLITRSYIPTHNTEISIQAARDCGLKINYVNLSVVERPDLAGYPNLQSDSDTVTYKSPYFLPALKEGETPDSIILFDEVDKAPHEVTAPLLEILQFGKINGKRINSAGCILTGNLMNEGANSNPISSALLDRGAKYILKFNFDKWMDWAKTSGMHDLILGFLTRDPDMACGDIETEHFASPSPRGWAMASAALYRAKTFGMSDIDTVAGIISGFVGSEAGMKFKMWYEYYKKFEPQILSLIEHGNYPLDLHKLSMTEVYIFCVTACHFAKRKIIETKSKIKQIQYAENIIKFFDYYKIDHEVQVVTMRNSFPFEFITKYKLYESKLFLEKSKSLQDEVYLKKY